MSHFYGGTAADTVDANQEMTVRIMSHDLKPLAAQVDSGGIATYTPGGAASPGTGKAIKIEPATGGFRISDAPSCAGPWATRPGTVAGTDIRIRAADITTFNFSYGTMGDVPITGDWNGDGVDTPGIWRAGQFHLRNSISAGPAHTSFTYGTSTDVPMVGDWDGDGVDTIGVRRGTLVYLRNSNSAGSANVSFGFGSSSDRILVGDWDGNGVDTVGVRRGNAWMLRNSNTAGPAELSFSYGLSSDMPVIGDWNGDGKDGVGVRRGTTWYQRDELSSGAATSTFSALGPGLPVAGHWTGAPADFVGRVDGAIWELGKVPQGGGVALLDGGDQPLARTVQLCHATSSGGWTSSAASSRFYRGELRAIATGAGGADLRVVNAVGLDWYVRGVVPRESPASWGNVDCVGGAPDCGQRALEAQAIAARSYSLGEGRYSYAKTCDTISCQVYAGRAYRASGSSTITLSEATNTNNAVASTAGAVRRMGNGSIARTEFSSSTGGWTVGGTFPSVPDDGDDVASNPNHSWRVVISGASLQSKYGASIGMLQSARVISRAGDGRAVASLVLSFSGGSVTRTGDQLRIDFGLKSSWFDLWAEGDEGAYATLGAHRGSLWSLRTDPGQGPSQHEFVYGVDDDLPVLGDWNGDGRDGPGVRRDQVWHLRNSLSAGSADVSFAYGEATDVPVTGDWNGDGEDGVGVRRGSTWYLRNALSAGGTDHSFAYGLATDAPVVGDWNGDGRSDPGVFRSGVFYLKTSLSGGAATQVVSTGLAGVPVAGDWDGDGRDEVGVVNGSSWTLILNLASPSLRSSMIYGAAGDAPTPGHWG